PRQNEDDVGGPRNKAGESHRGSPPESVSVAKVSGLRRSPIGGSKRPRSFAFAFAGINQRDQPSPRAAERTVNSKASAKLHGICRDSESHHGLLFHQSYTLPPSRRS